MQQQHSEQQVEEQAGREDVVLVELRRRADVRAPAQRAERGTFDAVVTEAAGGRLAQAAEQRAQRRLAAAGRSFEEDSFAAPDLEGAVDEHRIGAPGVAKTEIAGGDQRALRDLERGRGRGLGARCRFDPGWRRRGLPSSVLRP